MSYSREKIIAEIKQCLIKADLGNNIIDAGQESRAIHLIYKTPCYAAFFTIIQNGESLLDMYKKAQDEIVELRDRKRNDWPRDLNLVIFVDQETPLQVAFKREILDDRFVCRKFVLSINGNKLNSVLAELPFWPTLDISDGDAVSIVSDIQTEIKGYDPKLIADLASYRPGAEQVSKNICANEYKFESEKQTYEVDQSLGKSPIRIKLQSLSIKNFRGIRNLEKKDMDLSADITFIYGPNGVGKTSIADAIEWGITGQLNRLRELSRQFEKDSIINIFSEDKQTEVLCYFDCIDFIRRVRKNDTVKQWIGDRAAIDDRAVIDHVVGTEAPVPDNRLHIERLQELFRGSHMLSQHDMRSFLDDKNPETKFDILTNMIGAEEYIRFRDKVGSVLKHLKQELNSLSEDNKSINREYEDCLGRLLDRQKEYQGLSSVVTSGRRPKDVADELLKGLREIKCSIEDDKIKELQTEDNSKYFEFVVIHSQTVIENKTKAIDDLLLQIENINNGWDKFNDNTKKIDDVKKILEDKKKEALTISANLETNSENSKLITDKLQLQQVNQLQFVRCFKDLTWLKGNIEVYLSNKKKLAKLEEMISSNQDFIMSAEKLIKELQQALNAKKSRFVDSQKLFDEKNNKEQSVLLQKEHFAQIHKRFSEIENIKEKNKQIENKTNQLKGEDEKLTASLEIAQAQYGEISNAYSRESARYDELSSYRAKLVELISSDECPLCGRIFKSIDEAKSVIQEQLSNIPKKLKELTKTINQSNENIEKLKSQKTNVIRMLKENETEFNKNQDTISACKKDIFEYISDCNRAGIKVTEDNKNCWENILEQNLKECERTSLQSEINELKESINTFTTDLDKKTSKKHEIAQQLKTFGAQKTSLMEEIQGFETDAVAKSFKIEDLPNLDKLAASYEKAENDVKNINSLVNEKEAEIKKLEGVIKVEKERLIVINNDVLTQESYKKQLEEACSKYKIVCQRLGVNITDFTNSLSALKEKSIKIKTLLSVYDKSRIVLQQLISLNRISKEIETLDKNKNEIEEKIKISKEKIDRTTNWISRFDKLESEVVKKQIDAVGTHLKQLEPTTQRLYSRLCPHPIFGNLRIRIDDNSRKLDVEAEVSPYYKELEDIAVRPAAYFSDAQMNTLAIIVFLGGALRQRWSGLNTILIDDPIQQMDEMNVYAFLDLIRGLSDNRQFIIMTCSRDFYLLAIEKLDCLNKNRPGAFSAYRLDGVAPAELKVHCDTK